RDCARSVASLEQAMAFIGLWRQHDEPVDFDGSFWTLRDAVIGMGGYEGRFPPIWVGAHGPRMLDITGRYADGWLPSHVPTPEDYADRLARIKRAAAAAGRDGEAFTPGLWRYTIVAEDHAECHRLADQPLPKANMLVARSAP